jgi:PEP-CTERM motif
MVAWQGFDAVGCGPSHRAASPFTRKVEGHAGLPMHRSFLPGVTLTYKLTVLALVAAAGALALPAQAVTTNWGVHDTLEVAASITPVGAFEDFYNFSLTAENTLMSTAVSNNLGSVLGLADGKVSLFKEAGDADTAIGAYDFTATTGNISFPFGDLVAGSYYYLVSGTGTGSMGGFYSISSTIAPTASPVPEPDTVALMLAGFLGMGVLLRRRNREGQ